MALSGRHRRAPSLGTLVTAWTDPRGVHELCEAHVREVNGFIVLAVIVHMVYLGHPSVARVQSFRSKRLSNSCTTTETESATVETPSPPAAAAISN